MAYSSLDLGRYDGSTTLLYLSSFLIGNKECNNIYSSLFASVAVEIRLCLPFDIFDQLPLGLAVSFFKLYNFFLLTGMPELFV